MIGISCREANHRIGAREPEGRRGALLRLASPMLDDYRPPTLRERLTHPAAISGIILVVLVGGWQLARAYHRWERDQREAALVPIDAEWEQLRERAQARLARVQTALAGPSRSEQGCEGLQGSISVVHRPVLEGIVAAERFVQVDEPAWLSSGPHRYLAGSATPDQTVEQHLARNESVRAENERPCVAVLDTTLAEAPTLQGERRFGGGVVMGTLRVVCPDAGGLACEASLASAPMLAIVVEQRDSQQQPLADQMAVHDASRREYWQRVEESLATLAPGLRVEHDLPH